MHKLGYNGNIRGHQDETFLGAFHCNVSEWKRVSKMQPLSKSVACTVFVMLLHAGPFLTCSGTQNMQW